MNPSDESPFLDDVPWDENPNTVDYNSILFEKFYASLRERQLYWMSTYLIHPPILINLICGKLECRMTTLKFTAQMLMILMLW
jgi:hypothetical protein